MKSAASPFGRPAHTMLIEARADVEIELSNPRADPQRLVALNPAKRVATPGLPDGSVLTEAMAIARFARDIAPGGSRLKAQTTPARYEGQGLAFGVIEAAVHTMTGRKIVPDDLSETAFDSHPVAERRRATIVNGLGVLDGMTGRLSTDALGLTERPVVDSAEGMDFRFPGAEGRPAVSRIDGRIESVAHRPSVAGTVPS